MPDQARMRLDRQACVIPQTHYISLMKKTLTIFLMLSGLLIYQGLQRKDSLVGAASEVGSDLSRAVDGQGHIPKHYY